MRDKKGRFLKGHKALGSSKAMIEYIKKNGPWCKGLTKETDERLMKISRITKERMTGKKQSKKQIENRVKARKGFKHSEETKKQLSEINKGKHLSKETIKILDEKVYSKRRNRTYEEIYGIEKAKELKQKFSERMLKNNPYKGKHHSKEVGKRISEKQMGRIPWNKGKEYQQMKGKNHHNWKGGITPINEKIRRSIEYKLWRKAVLEMDNYTCRFCGKGGYLEADHIKSFSDYPELRFVIDNGRTLCKNCHSKTDTYGGKKPYIIRNKPMSVMNIVK